MALVKDIYLTSQAFPQEEIYGLTSQIRKCAVSIPSNIAEGYGRNSTGDYKRFLQIPNGSLYELKRKFKLL
jgi:four helix bundle protein